MTDLRALCAELTERLEWFIAEDDTNENDPDNQYWLTGKQAGIDSVARARAALAEGEKGPSDEELMRLAITSGIEEWWAEEDGNGCTEYCGKAVYVLAFARAVLARYGSAPRPADLENTNG